MQPSNIEKIEPGRLTEARLIEMVFPEQTNHYGTLFGGQALALMDKAAFIVASRFVRRAVVTACSEKIDFHVPVRQGHLVELRRNSRRPLPSKKKGGSSCPFAQHV